jgi:hypothetical protein
LDHNEIPHPSWFGFSEGLLCATQLVETIHDWNSSINQKQQIATMPNFQQSFKIAMVVDPTLKVVLGG